jgi:hypothetical protein
VSDSLFLPETPLVPNHGPVRVSNARPRKGRGRASKMPEIQTVREVSFQAAVENLYHPLYGGAWIDSFQRAMAEALYRAAWLEDRKRFGVKGPEDWGTRDCYSELALGEFDRAVCAANQAVRDRQQRPRRTAVDDRLAYYDSLK